MKRESIFREINDERSYQEEKKCFSTQWDDQQSPNDWVGYISAYAGRATTARINESGLANFRLMMLKVAALAVAAIEATDRKGVSDDHS